MKNNKLLFCAFLALIFFASCEKENEYVFPKVEWELSAPELQSSESNIVLNEEAPTESFMFSWTPAVSTAGFDVHYKLVIDSLGSEDYSTPILSKTSGNEGTDTSISFTASELDLALAYAGFPANSDAQVEIAVLAIGKGKKSNDIQEVTFKRFESMYKPEQWFISGAATENGTELTMATALRALKNAEGAMTYQFEGYTHLEAGQGFKIFSKNEMPAHVYGGSEGVLVKNGPAISVAESGEYKLTVNLEEQTYSLMKINKLSIVGNIIPGGWGGDEALEYVGDGVWQREMQLQVPEGGTGGFILRLNGDWGYLFKHIVGTEDELYMESQAKAAGITVEDIALAESANYTVSVDLSGESYTYSLDKVFGNNPPSETPESLYLLADGETVATFEKEGDVFKSVVYLALQEGVNYKLNSAEDGSGTAYMLTGAIGETSTPDADVVTGALNINENDGNISVAKDQAYQLTFDFATGVSNWKYYNIKLFHWDEAGGGWDSRDEFLMTYVHPYKFTTTQNLKAGYHMKFNSPWDIQFGADDPNAMSGTMTNNGGENFQNISTSGKYSVNIEVTNTYETGTYEFISE